MSDAGDVPEAAEPEQDHVAHLGTRGDPVWVAELDLRLGGRNDERAEYTFLDFVAELRQWAGHERASPWKRNRRSLRADYQNTLDLIGSAVRSELASTLARGEADVSQLFGVDTPVDPLRARVGEFCDRILSDLAGSGGVLAAWQDLVSAVQDDALPDAVVRSRAGLLRAVLDERGRGGAALASHLSGVIGCAAFDVVVARVECGLIPEPDEWPSPNEPIEISLDERMDLCGQLVRVGPQRRRCIGWVAFRGRLEGFIVPAGPVTFFDAEWAIPNATSDTGQTFAHRDEMRALRWLPESHERDHPSDLINGRGLVLARVDLGHRPMHGGLAAARRWATALVDVAAIPGQRWTEHGWQELVADGRFAGSSTYATDDERAMWPNPMAAARTAKEISSRGPELGVTIARDDVPVELEDAVAAVHEARHAGLRTRIFLHGRIVEAAGALCGVETDELEDAVIQWWPRASWRADVQNAIRHALDYGRYWTDEREQASDLLDQVFTDRNQTGGYIAHLKAAAEHATELTGWLSLNEHRREAVLIQSLTDPAVLLDLFDAYAQEAMVLSQRRRRVRNAITHGNPSSTIALRSVAPFACWVAEAGLNRAVEVYVTGRPLAAHLESWDAERTMEEQRLRAGESLLGIWTNRRG